MNSDVKKDRMRKLAEEERERQREIESNPLSQYSTSELKAELRRRKNR